MIVSAALGVSTNRFFHNDERNYSMMFSTTLKGASGELPDLIAFLSMVYRQEIKTPTGIQDPSDAFIGWARSYLAKYRPSEVFAVDNNYGVQLTNGQRIQLSPSDAVGREPAGMMASADSSIGIFSK